MTLKDVAQMAGVSVSTVSRVINDKETKAASKQVRERIWDIIRETGYVPNANAQYLRKNSSPSNPGSCKRYYACIYARSQNKDMFFTELSDAIEYEAYKADYILKYTFSAEELEKDSFISAISSDEISGIVVLGRFSEERINAVAESQKNVVYVGLNISTNKHDTVFCDGFMAARKAVETLFDYGHQKIAYIGEVKKENRYCGYCRELEEHNVELDMGRVVETKQGLEGGRCAIQKLLERNSEFTAIFCANDATAMGAIKALTENKIRVPEDVSVISIDDVEMARYFTPMLTTVHIPIAELGRQAAKTLIDRIEKGHTLPIKIEIPFSLSRRDSCAPRKKGTASKMEMHL